MTNIFGLNADRIAEIREGFLEYSRDSLLKVLNGELESCDLAMISPADISNILKELGAESGLDLESNGWEWDFWETWSYQDHFFSLTGSGWYGGISFSKIED